MKGKKHVYIFMTILFYGTLGFAMHLLARTWNLPFVWAVLGIQVGVALTGVLVLDEEFLAERAKPKGKDNDPLGPSLITLFYLFHLALAGLDLGRWHLSDTIPVVLQFAGLVLTFLGWSALLWSMVVNRFFSSAIRLQQDRGQKVIDSGPYGVIRHPGYAFASAGFIGAGLAFGSWICLVPVVVLIGQLMYRTLLEEKLLTQELSGYDDYITRVRFRWIPGVW